MIQAAVCYLFVVYIGASYIESYISNNFRFVKLIDCSKKSNRCVNLLLKILNKRKKSCLNTFFVNNWNF